MKGKPTGLVPTEIGEEVIALANKWLGPFLKFAGLGAQVQKETAMANVSPQANTDLFLSSRRYPANGQPESGTSELSAEDLNYGHFKVGIGLDGLYFFHKWEAITNF